MKVSWARLKMIRAKNLLPFGFVSVILLGSGVAVVLAWPQAYAGTGATGTPREMRLQFTALNREVRDFEDKQSRLGRQVVTDQTLQDALSLIQLDAARGRYAGAERRIKQLRVSLGQWDVQLVKASQPSPTPVNAAPVAVVATSGSQYFIPIVLYHNTPANFEQQLAHLEQHGYTTITMDEVARAMSGGGGLPAKPVVITYDDGFADQMRAYDILRQHHMKATYYIINAGEMSKWCIGAGRRYNDPLQPPQGCGDAYMTWDQVRELDRSGLIEIGGHTLDHPNLPTLSAQQQRMEIIDSKIGIEREIGHGIRTFAYPYGAYSQTSIDLVREAGYTTAVTTLPGTYQPMGAQYTLRRIRDTLTLP